MNAVLRWAVLMDPITFAIWIVVTVGAGWWVVTHVDRIELAVRYLLRQPHRYRLARDRFFSAFGRKRDDAARWRTR